MPDVELKKRLLVCGWKKKKDEKQMNKERLMEFIQHILENSSVLKAGFSLRELKEILEQQQAPEEMIRMVQMAADSVPEAKKELENGNLTEQDLEIVYKRAQERIAREEAARAYGRC